MSSLDFLGFYSPRKFFFAFKIENLKVIVEVYVVFMIQSNSNITIRICEEQK